MLNRTHLTYQHTYCWPETPRHPIHSIVDYLWPAPIGIWSKVVNRVCVVGHSLSCQHIHCLPETQALVAYHHFLFSWLVPKDQRHNSVLKQLIVFSKLIVTATAHFKGFLHHAKQAVLSISVQVHCKYWHNGGVTVYMGKCTSCFWTLSSRLSFCLLWNRLIKPGLKVHSNQKLWSVTKRYHPDMILHPG